jgi:GH15 family glucan-1,4-alpha-glucosidase
MNIEKYPAIADYAYIADCHSAALISKSGSIDWCCMPRIDSASCFGRLIGWDQGGFCQLAPIKDYTVSRRYLDHTLILETTFRIDDGSEARLTDCFTMRERGEHHPYQQILRVVEGVKGSVDFAIDIVPRFDYGRFKPWIRRLGDDHFIVIGGSDGLLISGDVDCGMKHRHDLEGTCTIKEGQRKYLSIVYRRSEELDDGLVDVPAIEELGRRLEETTQWWSRWAEKGKIAGPYAEYMWRSAIVLKGLTHAPTGAIAAAATTSLPEAPGGSRNWDYRYTWIRDSCFTVRSLAELGFHSESDGFRRFVERSAAGSAEELQILFGVGGERRLTEMNLKGLEGYRGARPVRIGNDAEMQRQLDVYGELLDLAWRWHTLGHSPDDDYWEFITELVNAAAKLWDQPDQGIWEIRSKARHFVQSKVMCWAAVDCGIRLAEDLGRDGPLDKWKKVRDEIRRAVEEKGYDSERGVFIQAFGHKKMDAALLLLPTVGFVDYRDERMIRTTDAVWQDLGENNFLRRYTVDDDELAGEEGAFLACSFWLVECLAYQDRFDEAHEVFKQVIKAGSDLYLFSEEYDTKSLEMLGNFPQGLTHLSLIAATVALAAAEERQA